MKMIKSLKALGITVFLLTALSGAANAQVTNLYQDDFNSYSAEVTLATAFTSGPNWRDDGSPYHALASGGQGGAGDLYALGQTSAGNSYDLTYSFFGGPTTGGHYGGTAAYTSLGQYFVTQADSYAQSYAANHSNYSGSGSIGVGAGAGAAGTFAFAGNTSSGGWSFNVGSIQTATNGSIGETGGSNYTYSFPINTAEDQWVHLTSQIDDVNNTVQGFLQYSGGVLETPLISLNPANFSGAGEAGASYLRDFRFITDDNDGVTPGTFGINLDNADIYMTNTPFSPTPEPSSFVLVGLGALLLWRARGNKFASA